MINRKSQMREREEYEELYACVGTERASESEIADLQSDVCDYCACATLLTKLAELAGRFTQRYGLRKQSSTVNSRKATYDFIEYARRQGVPLQRTSEMKLTRPHALAPHVWAGVVMLCVAIFAGGMSMKRSQEQPNNSAERGERPKTAPYAFHGNPVNISPDTQDRVLSSELAQSRAKQKDIQDQIRELKRMTENLKLASESRWREAKVAADGREQILVAREADLAGLQRALRNETARANSAEAQLAAFRQAEPSQLAEFLQQQNDLKQLSAEVEQLRTENAENRKVLSSGAQVRDLVTARNLHIIDVHDNERTGKRRTAFGRIFYTEGQSLVFYVYDLADQTGANKLTFHVWGEQLGGNERAKQLGELRAESEADGRWVLSFDDPKVLAQINTVFVTAESSRRKSDEPKGNRILYAFIDGTPNHP